MRGLVLPSHHQVSPQGLIEERAVRNNASAYDTQVRGLRECCRRRPAAAVCPCASFCSACV